jgi:Tfp pilus assembly protein PilF
MLGLMLAQDGKAAEAAQEMAQALSLEPNFCAVLAWQADQAQAKGDKAGAQMLTKRVFSARALKADSPDGYTAYIQSVDPAWLARHHLFTR